jgi:peptide/nickel transport system substrate-binding protein
MTRPFATLPEQLAGILTAQIVPAGFTAKSKPNGTGPFRYQSSTPGQRSVFTRNPRYRQHPLPYAGTLTIIDFPDTTSLTDALRTGQVHAAGTLNPQQVPELAVVGGVKVVVSQAGTIVPFTMRLYQAPFSDVRVRQAMRLLADRPRSSPPPSTGRARFQDQASAGKNPGRGRGRAVACARSRGSVNLTTDPQDRKHL